MERKLAIISILVLLPLVYFFWIFTAEPPEEEVEIYKGLWMPILSEIPFAHAASFNLKELKDVGINTVGFAFMLKVERNGEIHSTTPWNKVLTIFQIKRLHRAGLKVMLTNELLENFGEPSPISEEILDNEDFWENLNRTVVENAELAERYGVELYAPLNEPEAKFWKRENKSWEWAQEILREIKKVYHGKIIWKGDFSAQMHDPKFNFSNANFSGYDMVGFSITMRMPPEEYEKYVEEVIEIMMEIVEHSNTELIVSEFGAWEEPWNKNISNVKFAYEIVLEKGFENGLKGFFALDGPALVTQDPTFHDFKSVIEKWFRR